MSTNSGTRDAWHQGIVTIELRRVLFEVTAVCGPRGALFTEVIGARWWPEGRQLQPFELITVFATMEPDEIREAVRKKLGHNHKECAQ